MVVQQSHETNSREVKKKSESETQMDNLYIGHMHGFPGGLSNGEHTQSFSPSSSVLDDGGGMVTLGITVGSSFSLVGLAFTFITYRLVSVDIIISYQGICLPRATLSDS